MAHAHRSVARRRACAAAKARVAPCLAPAGTQAISSGAPPSAAFDAAAALAGRFAVPAAEVQRWLGQVGGSMDELLVALTQPASSMARPPISNFHVGAVGLAADGSLVLGVNLEFPGMPLNQSVHAEQFMVANAAGAAVVVAGGGGGAGAGAGAGWRQPRELAAVAVNAAPCGHCRQFFSEVVCADRMHLMFPSGAQQQQEQEQQQPRRWRLADLLPARFGPLDLLAPPVPPLLLQPQANALAWQPQAAAVLAAQAAGDGSGGGGAELEAAAEAALAAARRSYAPYSGCPSGVALLAEGGAIYAGSYLESAAYNPGLHPLQAALVAAVMDGLPSYGAVGRVVLAERAGGVVQQARVVRELARAATGHEALEVLVLHV